MRRRAWLSAILLLQTLKTIHSQVLGIDTGHEYLKVSKTSRGKLEMVFNEQSQRKTATAISFVGKTRAFGDDAVADFEKRPSSVPMYFLNLLDYNESLDTNQQISVNGFPNHYYPYTLRSMEKAEGKVFQFCNLFPEPQSPPESDMPVEEIFGHLLGYIRSLAEAAENEAIETVAKNQRKASSSIIEVALTVPSSASQRYRKSMTNAARIGGFKTVTLVHETTAAVIQLASQVELKEKNSTSMLFINIGAVNAEVCITRLTAIPKKGSIPIPHAHMQGCARSRKAGGHLLDLLIADFMILTFCDKHPGNCEALKKSPRAMSKLIRAAKSGKHVLSSNSEATLRVENIVNDIDFYTILTRSKFEQMVADAGIHLALQKTVNRALEVSKMHLSDIQEVEVLGGGWRVPYVFRAIKQVVDPIAVGQRLNGDEAMAFGAALVAANFSKSFRVRQLWLSDVNSEYKYHAEIEPLIMSEANKTKSFTLSNIGEKLYWKKTINLKKFLDVKVSVFENENLLFRYEVNGSQNILKKMKDGTNATGISLKFESQLGTGIISLEKAELLLEEWRNQSIPRSKNEDLQLNHTVAGSQNVTEMEAPMLNESLSSNHTQASDINLTETQTWKGIKRGIQRPMNVFLTEHAKLRYMTEEEVTTALNRREGFDSRDKRFKDTEKLRNECESYIYMAREKMGGDSEEINVVSTEEERKEITQILANALEWLDENEKSGQLEDYENKIAELTDASKSIFFRAREVNDRAALKEEVNKMVQQVNKSLEEIREKKFWVSNETRWNIANQTHDFTVWFRNLSLQQDSTPLTEPPVFTVSSVRKKMEKIMKEIKQLIRSQYVPPKNKTETNPQPGSLDKDLLKEMVLNASISDPAYNKSKLDNMTNDELLKEWTALLSKKYDSEKKSMFQEEETRADNNSKKGVGISINDSAKSEANDQKQKVGGDEL